MYIITDKDFSETVNNKLSAIRILVNCGIPKQGATKIVSELEIGEKWVHASAQVSIEKIS